MGVEHSALSQCQKKRQTKNRLFSSSLNSNVCREALLAGVEANCRFTSKLLQFVKCLHCIVSVHNVREPPWSSCNFGIRSEIRARAVNPTYATIASTYVLR